MRSFFVLAALALVACGGAPSENSNDTADELKGPGKLATDQRVPELGKDVKIVRTSRVDITDALADDMIEAKFELGDDQKLSLSLYPVKDMTLDAERNVFQELSFNPTLVQPEKSLDTFTDQEHLTRSARDLTLMQLSSVSLADVVWDASWEGQVYWAIPTIRQGRAGFGVYVLRCDDQIRYHFVDGEGASFRTAGHPTDLGPGPGAKATDARTPELDGDPSIALKSKITMSQALAQLEPKYGPMIEAKFEIGDDGNLSLSLYPTGKGIDVDAERNTFFELAGDPTAASFAPELSEFVVPDAEHLTRSARDLTLVQTAGIGLRGAVQAVEKTMPGGFVYWAIPTIRDTRAGYGIYVYGTDKKSHYFFISG